VVRCLLKEIILWFGIPVSIGLHSFCGWGGIVGG
jgi:hypothetical protein